MTNVRRAYEKYSQIERDAGRPPRPYAYFKEEWEADHPEELSAMVENAAQQALHVRTFVQSRITKHPEGTGGYKTSIMVQDVYQPYKEWCDQQHIKHVDEYRFGRILRYLFEKKQLRWKLNDEWVTRASIVDVMWKD